MNDNMNIFLTGGTGFIGSYVATALRGEDIEPARHDGTQFIHAADLAKIYTAVLHSGMNRQIYLVLGREYITWEQIAEQTIALTGSSSRIVLTDGGFSPRPGYYLLDKIAHEFGFEFTARDKIQAHPEYLCGILR